MGEDLPVREPTRTEEHRLAQLSPFELKDHLIALAGENLKQAATTMLNAGRGNPNWIATTPREAFFLLGQFGLKESRRSWDEYDALGGTPSLHGIASRLDRFLDDHEHEHDDGASFLRRAAKYATGRFGISLDYRRGVCSLDRLRAWRSS